MSKNKIFTIIVLILALVALPILAVCQSSDPDRALAAGPEEFEAEESAEFDYEQAADNMAYRWQAMAEGYERLGMLNDDMDPGDVSAFRWLAIARGYESLGLLNEK